MDFIKKYFGDLFLTSRFYVSVLASVILFLFAFYIPALNSIAVFGFFVFITFCVIDYIFLFFSKKSASAKRYTAGRLSNGDENRIELIVKNDFSFPVSVKVIDELPPQFQVRNWERYLFLKARQQKKIHWFLRPLQRGEYHFGNIHLFVSSPLKFFRRRVTVEAGETIHVYPSFMQLHKYELLSNATIQHESGSSRYAKDRPEHGV